MAATPHRLYDCRVNDNEMNCFGDLTARMATMSPDANNILSNLHPREAPLESAFFLDFVIYAFLSRLSIVKIKKQQEGQLRNAMFIQDCFLNRRNDVPFIIF